MTGPPPAVVPDPTSPAQLQALFRSHGFRPRRALGQTFLVDANIVRKIVAAADLSPDDCVLEIGPGAGAVTRALVRRARRVVAIELDPVLVKLLKETVGEAAEVIRGDVLSFPLSQVLGQRASGLWKVVGNLPYSITGPAILRLLGERQRIASMVIMVQAEVGDRLLAPPGSRQRGWLTPLMEICAETSLVARVSRNCFWPRPKVDSAILALRVRRPPLIPPDQEVLVQDVIKAAFATRRKTVLNALSHARPTGTGDKVLPCGPKESTRALLQHCGIRPDLRAEALTAQDFLRLAEALAARTGEGHTR